jgi:APA family basic amino acid/polyamine antiporter
VGPLAVVGCLYLFTSLKSSTIAAFFCWMGIGLIVYLLYGVRKSALAQAGA